MIGGGDTGTDCVGTSMRQGCKSLTQIEIMADAAAWIAPTDNPWPEWPKVYKLDYGQEEAAAKFGADPRVYLTTVKKFVGDDARQPRRRRHREDRLGEERQGPVRAGRSSPAARRSIPRSSCCSPWASSGPSSRCSRTSRSRRDARTNVKAEYGKYATSIPGVFAAGDCRRGQSLVVWAINEGRGAARECDRYLMGATELP